MPDDIVERLRYQSWYLPAEGDTEEAHHLAADALAEIERLRDDLAEERQRRRDDLIGQRYRDEEYERSVAEAAVLTEKLAQAWRERDHAKGQHKFRAELAYLMACERDDLAAQLQPIIDAWTVEGPHPPTHWALQQNLHYRWPTLARAIANAAKGEA